MNKNYLLGVDIGTYESKGVITDLDGQVIGMQVTPHKLDIPCPGWAEHDPEAVWWGDFVQIVKKLLAETGIDARQILGVGCSAIGVDVLPVDKDCKPLRSGAILYGVDTRAHAEIIELENKIGRELIFQKSGNELSAQAAGPKILWLKKNEPDVYKNAYKFVTATTFLVARLTGNYFIDHLTGSFCVPLYDLFGRKWDDSLTKEIIDLGRLPDLAWTNDIAGKITHTAAQQTGLAEGTPVIVGTVDAASESVSVGVVRPGQMMLMYGSTIFIIEVLDKPIIDKRIWSSPYLFEGTSALMAGMATSGSLTRWFRDQIAQDLITVEKEGGENAYAELVKEAEKVAPGSEGLIVIPYFSGERTPVNDPRAKGVYFGLTLAHTRGHMFRSALEGMGYGIRHHIDIMKEIGAEPSEIVSVGGGTKNSLWLQVVSDISGKPQQVPALTMGASYGDAFLAGLGVGVFSSYNDIRRWVRDIRTVEPDHTHKDIYEKYHQLYLELYRRTKDVMHELW